MFLAGDIGGTKTRIGLFRAPDAPARSATYRSADHSGLLPIVREFLDEEGGERPAAACFGIAGPVRDNRCSTPNLPWNVDGDALAAEAGLPVVQLVNDLAATADGIPLLAPEDLVELNPGAEGDGGDAALIAAGTGLGMALIDRSGGGWRAMPSEGGHQSFSPRDARERALLERLQAELGHVSTERVVSGPGLVRVYHCVAATGVTADREIAQRIEAADDAAAEVAGAGLAGRCPACAEALELFLAAYGAAAGDLALVALATGGIYVGGGIAPKLWPRLGDGTFRDGFLDKGRMRSLLATVPVRLVRNPDTALLGAARRAGLLAGGTR
jgi:glucokinase